MATFWKSQQGNGEFALQFETDDREKYKLVEKAAQMAVDGKTAADVVEVVRCEDCKHCDDMAMSGLWCNHPDNRNPLGCRPGDFCNDGVRKD